LVITLDIIINFLLVILVRLFAKLLKKLRTNFHKLLWWEN